MQFLHMLVHFRQGRNHDWYWVWFLWILSLFKLIKHTFWCIQTHNTREIPRKLIQFLIRKFCTFRETFNSLLRHYSLLVVLLSFLSNEKLLWFSTVVLFYSFLKRIFMHSPCYALITETSFFIHLSFLVCFFSYCFFTKHMKCVVGC